MGRSDDLHGNAPDQCPVAVLFVDVANRFAFPQGAELARRALPVAGRLARLRRLARAHGVPCIFVNDNLGRWRSSFPEVVARCRQPDSAGKRVIERLLPEARDYFVLKPKHSGFYATCLELLLAHLGTQTVLICGFSAESCVVFTAHDAYLRGYQIVVPSDGTASIASSAKRVALAHIRETLGAKTPQIREVSFVGGGAKARLRLRARG